ncbi:MAG: hypothetical protein F6K58_08525 [Symploca sp. SIO2E9]|nr:hypothetical protein [Symploca sp. SIO2E9]
MEINDNHTPKKVEFVKGEGLKIPVIDMSITDEDGNQGRYLAEPEVLRNSMLELLFEPEELESLVIVKPDKDNDSLDPLKGIDFGNGIARRVAFSSGNNIYYADAQLSKKLLEPFKTQPDHACRYGSLLVSTCTEGAHLLDSTQDGKPLRVKIVNFESDDAGERTEAAQYCTGDCHGKISPQLAKKLGWSDNHPFQFRLSWMNKWSQQESHTPDISFLAKGTFLPDAELTDKQGYDLIIDRSSVKGIAKHQIDDLLPCGDYEFPQIALGNRGNAKVQEYENSWQFSIWYSEAAIKADIVEPSKTEARKLAALQSNPIKLKNYLVKQYDKKAAFTSTQKENEATDLDQDSEEDQRSESRMISLLRHDQYGQLLDFPKVASFMRDQLAKKWRDLAIKGAVHHGSAMAQPCNDLKSGTIVAPHLKHGTQVLVTRYPIVSKDNIRRYTVDNKQQPELLKYRGCAFIRPDQAMQHHQCDFDGDQLVITPASRMPHIATETRHANQENEYEPVQKRQKIDYTQAKDEQGKLKYTKLRQIAVAIAKNKIGWVATLIGRVQSSVPESGQPPGLFEQKKRQLLNKLFDALQIEVDSPKSATRLEDHHPNLLNTAKKWSQRYPSHLFDFKKDERLYKTMPMPAKGGNAINAIARDAVNPAWEPTRIRSRHRDEFRYLFPPPEDLEERENWEKHYVSWAKEMKERYREAMGEIHQQHGDDTKAIKEAALKLYESLRADVAEVFPNPESRHMAAAAMWHVETSNPNLNQPRKACAQLSHHLQITFHLEPDCQRLHEALPQDTYILNVPFDKFAIDEEGKIITDKKRQPVGEDLAGEWKAALERKGIAYEATLHPVLPMVNFALLDPSEKLIEVLEQKFGDNFNDIDELDLTYCDHLGQTKNISNRIVPPVDYTWVESTEEQTPKSALVLNLFAEEISEQLQDFRFQQAELIGQKYNDFKDEDFGDSKWRGKRVALEVGALDNPNDYRHGSPIVKLDGKQLAMFSTNSPKLPIGASFEATIEPSPRGSALTLNINPESVQLKAEAETEQALPSSQRERLKKLNFRFSQAAAQPDMRDAAAVASRVLHEAIAEKYAETRNRKIKVGDWTAFVNSRTQECFVRDKERRVIFHSDLSTNQVNKGLSKEDSIKFEEWVGQKEKLRSLKIATSVGKRETQL